MAKEKTPGTKNSWIFASGVNKTPIQLHGWRLQAVIRQLFDEIRLLVI